MNNAHPHADALVFFGATGDLAYKKIFPALQAMLKRGNLDVPVIGVAGDPWSLDQLKARAKDSLEKHSHLDPAAYAKLCSLLGYVGGDYRQPDTFARLRQALGNAQRPMHYLAIPPSLFATVAEGLSAANCVADARVVIEKPFGRDLASAQELNRTLHSFFPEKSIYRIDHYLGKETVQNLIYFRFANPIVEAGWNARHIESVQITMAESFGVQGRGKFYEEAGAIRDVVQNHMLEVVACLAIECPAEMGHESRRDERGRLLKEVRTLTPADVVRGQFRGYRNEPGVAPDSQVETFAALRFFIDSKRWTGVPFYVRVGKNLPATITEVMVRFKHEWRAHVHHADHADGVADNYYRFRLSPEFVVALGAKVKKPGEHMEGEAVELVAHYQPPDEREPYERLLSDAAMGDGNLFARQDAVEASWRIVEPILDNATPVHDYEPNTWGPAEAASITPEGGWHNPET
jgi:glucose-6-phosphate 1-dehydrogenase